MMERVRGSAVRVAVAMAMLVTLTHGPLAHASNLGSTSIDRKAISAARAEVERHPENAGARMDYAELLRSVFRYGEAREQLAEAAKLDPDDAEVWLELARVEILAGQRGPAGSHAQKAVSLSASEPEDSPTRLLAAQLLERMAAAVRMGARHSPPPAPGSAAALVAAVVDAARRGDFDAATARLVRPDWAHGVAFGETLTQTIALAHDHLGVRFQGFEVTGGDGPDRARLRMSWAVAPETLDFDLLTRLPPAYLSFLPLSWADRFADISEPALASEAIQRARSARWTDVTVAEVQVENGRIVHVRTGGDDLLATPPPLASLPPESSQAAGPDAGSGPPQNESALRHEMFRNRYGKPGPTTGPPYMWRQMIFGLIISALAGLGLIWLIRRNTR